MQSIVIATQVPQVPGFVGLGHQALPRHGVLPLDQKSGQAKLTFSALQEYDEDHLYLLPHRYYLSVWPPRTPLHRVLDDIRLIDNP